MSLTQPPKREQKPHPKFKFTSEEDAQLKQLVQIYGIYSWNQIAKIMGHRNPRQCKERWFNYLSPMIKNTPWSADEDKLLEKKFEEFGPKWVKIAKFFPMRTDIHIKNRWLVLSRKKSREAQMKNQQTTQSTKVVPKTENKAPTTRLPSINQLPNVFLFPSTQMLAQTLLESPSLIPQMQQNSTVNNPEKKMK